MTALRINDIAPNFTADTSDGEINFHDFIGNNWVVLFSHPKDFTPICTTEFGTVAKLLPEFAKRNAKPIGISVDTAEDHRGWKKDIEKVASAPANFPIIDDSELKVAKLYNMLPAEAYLPDGRTPADSATVRNVYIIDPNKKIRTILVYPMSVGRNYQEILRTLDALQLTDSGPFATPADWKVGEKIVVGGSVSTDDAKAKYGDVDVQLPYLRFINQPK